MVPLHAEFKFVMLWTKSSFMFCRHFNFFGWSFSIQNSSSILYASSKKFHYVYLCAFCQSLQATIIPYSKNNFLEFLRWNVNIEQKAKIGFCMITKHLALGWASECLESVQILLINMIVIYVPQGFFVRECDTGSQIWRWEEAAHIFHTFRETNWYLIKINYLISPF